MNRQETELLVESWRKVLNNSSYKEEEMLNEINLKSTLLSLAVAASALVPSYSEAVPTSTIQDEISVSIENRTDGKVSAYNVPGENGYMTIVAKSEEQAKKIANNYEESGEENVNILIYGQEDARNINARELSIIKLAIEHGGPLTKIVKKARSDKSSNLADEYNKEIAKTISDMSDREIENMYDIAESAAGPKKMKKITNFALKKMNSGASYDGPEGVGKINPDDINIDNNKEYSQKHRGNVTFRSFDGYSETANKKAGLVFFFVLPDTLKTGSNHDRLRSLMFDRQNSNFNFGNLVK